MQFERGIFKVFAQQPQGSNLNLHFVVVAVKDRMILTENFEQSDMKNVKNVQQQNCASSLTVQYLRWVYFKHPNLEGEILLSWALI